MDFTVLHIFNLFYFFSMSAELLVSCQTPFGATVYKFNGRYFPSSLLISHSELSRITGLGYPNLARTQKQLIDYRYTGVYIIESVITCGAKQISVPYNLINYRLFKIFYDKFFKNLQKEKLELWDRSDILPKEEYNSKTIYKCQQIIGDRTNSTIF